MYAIMDFYDAISAVSQGRDENLVEGLGKVASILSDVQVAEERPESGLDDSQFGLIYETKTATVRRYALDTPENAKLSLACFEVFGCQVSPEETVKTAGANIINACERFGIGIPESLDAFKDPKVATNIAPAPKQKTVEAQVDEDHYLFVVSGTPRYPVKTAEQVKMACDYFDATWRDKGLRPDMRVEMARRIAKRAEALDVPVSDTVKAFSGETYSPHLKAAMDARKTYAGSQEHVSELDALMARQDEIGPEKFAEELYAIDARNGQARYKRAIPDPWTSVFLDSSGGAEKQASLQSDGPVVRAAWKLASQGKLAKIIGSGALSDFSNDPGATILGLDAGAQAAILASGA